MRYNPVQAGLEDMWNNSGLCEKMFRDEPIVVTINGHQVMLVSKQLYGNGTSKFLTKAICTEPRLLAYGENTPHGADRWRQSQNSAMVAMESLLKEYYEKGGS